MVDWSVLVAQPQRTGLVAENLTLVGVEHFIPSEEVVTIRGGRHHYRRRPLFGRYVLYVVNELWKSLASMRGVSGLLLANDKSGFAIQPALVHPKQMDALMEMCPNGNYHKAKDATGEFVYGQRVTPKSGPFAYHIGHYDGKARKQGNAALFTLFGHEQRVIFRPGELVAV